MKKILYAIASVLEAALLIGTYIFHYFTRIKLGMSRYVGFMNRNWQEKYPLETWKFAAVAATLLLTVLLLALLIKKRKMLTVGIGICAAAMAVLSFGYMGFTLFLCVDKLRSYYFISLMLWLAALIQIIKVFVRLVTVRKQIGEYEE